jgi:hypothetical protein
MYSKNMPNVPGAFREEMAMNRTAKSSMDNQWATNAE